MQPKETYNSNIKELNKILGLKFSGISANWIKVKLSADGNENPFYIHALISLNNNDTVIIDSLKLNKDDIRNSISIDNKTFHRQIFEKVKKHCVKDSDGYYCFNVPVYSTKWIIKNSLLTGYFVPLKRNLLFLTVSSDR